MRAFFLFFGFWILFFFSSCVENSSQALTPRAFSKTSPSHVSKEESLTSSQRRTSDFSAAKTASPSMFSYTASADLASICGCIWTCYLHVQPDVVLYGKPEELSRDRSYAKLLSQALSDLVIRGGETGFHVLVKSLMSSHAMYFTSIMPEEKDGPVSVAFVLKGVPSDFDPRRLVDDKGRFIFDTVTRFNDVTLYEAPSEELSLFDLGGLNWAVTSGKHPRPPKVERHEACFSETKSLTLFEFIRETDLVRLSLKGESLVNHVSRLRVGPLAPLGYDLDFASLVMSREKSGLQLELNYTRESSAKDALELVHQIVEESNKSQTGGEKLRWLRAAKLEKAGQKVRLEVR